MPISIFGRYQHQVFLSLGGGQSKEILDTKDNQYHVSSFVSGIGYRYQYIFDTRVDQFLSINFGLGGGMVFPQSVSKASITDAKIVNENSFLDLEIGIGYGLSFGTTIQHQMPLLGFSLLPKFVGLINKNNYTPVGDTEVKWFDGFYMPFFVGIALPSYRFVIPHFFVGFSHRVTMLIAGQRNVFIPEKHLILSGIGYEFRLEIGWNYAKKIENNDNKGLRTTQLFMSTNGQRITISLFAKMREEDTEKIRVEFFALRNEESSSKELVGYASEIPVFNEQAQFTKHWSKQAEYTHIEARIYELNTSGEITGEHQVREEL
ncbi:MAG: hypothetical protein ACRCTJ_06625 [Brevinema sp.]